MDSPPSDKARYQQPRTNDMTTENQLIQYTGDEDFQDMRRSDIITPMLQVQQFNSKLVQSREVMAGDIVDMVSKSPVYKSPGPKDVEHKTKIIPIAYFLQWIEWNTDRDASQKILRQTADFNSPMVKEAERAVMVTNKDGKQVRKITEYYNFVCLLPEYTGNYSDSFIIPFSKTGHAVGKEWLNRMRKMTDSAGKPFPMFMHEWEFSSVLKTKGNDKWYLPLIGSAKRVDPEYYGHLDELRKGFNLAKKAFAERAAAAHEAEGNTTDASASSSEIS
jgi:hypothetical protein